jgi:hypothetical protein
VGCNVAPCGGNVTATCNNGIFTGITDGCSIQSCAAQAYATAGCGNVTLPLTPNGNIASVVCGGCPGVVEATCSGTTFVGITEKCCVGGCPVSYTCINGVCTPNPPCVSQNVPTVFCGNATLPVTADGAVGSTLCPVGSCGTVSATCNAGSFGPVTEICLPAYWDTFTVAAAPAANSKNDQSFTRCYPSSFTVITKTSAGAGGCGNTGIPGTVCTLTVTNSCPSTPSCSDGIKNYGETAIDCGGPCNACGTCGQKTCYKCSGTSCVSDITGTHTVSNCSNTCIAFCGNGVLDAGEDCDPPAVRSNTNCAGSPGAYCMMPGCTLEACCGTFPC